MRTPLIILAIGLAFLAGRFSARVPRGGAEPYVRTATLVRDLDAAIEARSTRDLRQAVAALGARNDAEARAALAAVVMDLDLSLPPDAGRWFADALRDARTPGLSAAALKRDTQWRKLDASDREAWYEIVVAAGGKEIIQEFADWDFYDARHSVAISSNPIAVRLFHRALEANERWAWHFVDSHVKATWPGAFDLIMRHAAAEVANGDDEDLQGDWFHYGLDAAGEYAEGEQLARLRAFLRSLAADEQREMAFGAVEQLYARGLPIDEFEPIIAAARAEDRTLVDESTGWGP